MRSDASEEPQRPTHGRATRAAGNTVNGWPRGRKHIETYNSLDEMDDEDDATSWDGGDEDEDEPDQMDLDDDKDDSGDDASDEEMEPKSLVVRLKYPKGAFNPPKAVPTVQEEDLIKPEPAAQQSAAPTGPAVIGMGGPAPSPAHIAQLAARPQSFSNMPSNGIQAQQGQPAARATVPVVQGPLPSGDPHTLPKLESFFSPTPPYSAPEEPNPQTQFPVSKAEPSQPPHPFPTTLPTPTPASSWQ